eukprot:3122231-Prymnesium_polylepis.1
MTRSAKTCGVGGWREALKSIPNFELGFGAKRKQIRKGAARHASAPRAARHALRAIASSGRQRAYSTPWPTSESRSKVD